MYLERFLCTVVSYLHAFVKVLFSVSLFGAAPGTKSQVARFYFVVLIIGAFSIFYLLFDSNFFSSDTGQNHPALSGVQCQPSKGLAIWSVFVLAEVVSVVIYLSAFFAASFIRRYGSAAAKETLPVSSQHLALALHRHLLPWFSLALVISVFEISPSVGEVVRACHDPSTKPTWQQAYDVHLAIAQIWPMFFSVALVILAVQAAVLVWRKSIPGGYSQIVVVIVFCITGLASYSLALGLVGPSDVFGIVKLLRYVSDPKNFLHLLIG